jgi:hypothetical protein
MSADLSLRPLIFACWGFIVWAAHFTGIYAYAATVCTHDPGSAGQRLPAFILSTTALAIAFELFIGVRSLPVWKSGASGFSSDMFVRRLAMEVAAVATVVMVWEILLVLFVPACTQVTTLAAGDGPHRRDRIKGHLMPA